jgi:hypothetical protein
MYDSYGLSSLLITVIMMAYNRKRAILVLALLVIGLAMIGLIINMDRLIMLYVSPIHVQKYPQIPKIPDSDAKEVCAKIIDNVNCTECSQHLFDLNRDCMALALMNESACSSPQVCTNIALLKKDDGICVNQVGERFNEPEYTFLGRHWHVNNCLVEAAKSIRDMRICDKIVVDADNNLSDGFDTEAEGRTAALECQAYVADDELLCGNIQSNPPGLGIGTYCYVYFALHRNDPSICERVHDLSTRNLCRLVVAVQTGNASICENAQMYGEAELEGKRYECLASVSNPQWCDEYDSLSDRENCYDISAVMRQDPGLCEKAGDLLRGHCLFKVARSMVIGKFNTPDLPI